MHEVAIVAFPGCQALDVTGPFEVFAGAREAQVRRGALVLDYRPRVVGAGRSPIRCESGMRLLPDRTLQGASPDTLIIAGGAGARRAAGDPKLVRAVGRAAARAGRVASVCTGAFVLAAAGLLDGKSATTHWAFCEELAKSFPRVDVQADPIFVRDGSVWTSAGVTAGIDLALAMVEEDLGREVSLLLARWLVMFVRRAGGQSQFSAPLMSQTVERAPLGDVRTFIVEHPEAQLDVPALARRAAMSVRHFSRVFRAETGVSPASYVEQVRVETARRLLETSRHSVEEVARAAGFGTPEALRRAFSRRVGISPSEYRARFGAGERKGVRDGHRRVRVR